MLQKTILIVDDEKRMADSLAALLEDAGYQPSTAYGGRQAMELLTAQAFNVAIIDLRMPDIDGIDLIHAIQRIQPHIQTIVATAYASTDSAIEAVHCHVFEYIRKPFDFEHLLHTVQAAFLKLETDQLREDTAAMISHDIKIPLTSIIGFASMIYNRETGQFHPRAVEFTETIEANGQKILELIENYLTTCRIEAGSLQVFRRPARLDTLIEDIVSTALFSAERVQCEIIRELDPDNRTYWLDEGLIFRALSNLLQNAIKYNRHGRPVRLRTGRLDAQHSPLGRESLFLEVLNETVALHPEELDGIFARFQRGTLTGGVEGSGIGLYVVNAVAEAHGGRARAQMVDKRTVCFGIDLPIVEGDEPNGIVSPPQ